MADIYNIISIVAFSLAGIFLILSIFFWFKYKIPKIIGDLSGRTARKSIAQMRSENEKSGARPQNVRYHTAKTEKQIENQTAGEKLVTPDVNIVPNTPPINPIPPVIPQNADFGGTEVIDYSEGATALLDSGTEVLNYDPSESYKKQQVCELDIIQNLVLIHTDEII